MQYQDGVKFHTLKRQAQPEYQYEQDELKCDQVEGLRQGNQMHGLVENNEAHAGPRWSTEMDKVIQGN